MVKNALLFSTFLLISSVSYASLQTIPTEFNVRCGISGDVIDLKISENLGDVFVCTAGQPGHPSFSGSAISGEGKVTVKIGKNVFPETSLYTYGLPDQKRFQPSDESCEDLNGLTLVVFDPISKSYYGLEIRKDRVTIYQDGSAVCQGSKK